MAIPDIEVMIQKELRRRVARINQILKRALQAKSLDRPDTRRSIEEAKRLSFFRRGLGGNPADAITRARRRAEEHREPYIVATYDGVNIVVMPKKRLKEGAMGLKESNVIFDTSLRKG